MHIFLIVLIITYQLTTNFKMNIKLIQIGKTSENYLQEGIAEFEKRLSHYVKFRNFSLKLSKNRKFANIEHQKKEEAKLFLSNINDTSILILLDEKGKQFDSRTFSKFLQLQMNTVTEIIFFIGGPFGFSEEVYQRANHVIALSKMTMTHQMVRLFFTEQLYRACTILKGEKYHH